MLSFQGSSYVEFFKGLHELFKSLQMPRAVQDSRNCRCKAVQGPRVFGYQILKGLHEMSCSRFRRLWMSSCFKGLEVSSSAWS